jgi:hypothetical protein
VKARKKSIYTLHRFNKYLWLIKQNGETIAFISYGSYKRYYVLLREPREAVAEDCMSVAHAFEAFRRRFEGGTYKCFDPGRTT